MVAKIKPSADAPTIMMRRLRFLAAIPTRGTSIEERFDVNPAGRTIVSSFDFRCGSMVESKLGKCATKVDHRIRGAYQWNGCGDNDDCETNCFCDKIVARFVSEILSANVPKVRRIGFDAASAIPIQRHCAVIAFNQGGFIALANNC